MDILQYHSLENILLELILVLLIHILQSLQKDDVMLSSIRLALVRGNIQH
jgi:type IV secretory pathway VirB3-like protein